MNLPATALDMIRRFLREESFDDVPLPSEEVYYQKLLASSQDSIDMKSSDIYTGHSDSSKAVVLAVAIILVLCVAGTLGYMHLSKLLSPRNRFKYSPSISLSTMTRTSKDVRNQYKELPTYPEPMSGVNPFHDELPCDADICDVTTRRVNVQSPHEEENSQGSYQNA